MKKLQYNIKVLYDIVRFVICFFFSSSGDTAMFVLAPGIKEALAKNSQVLPQSLIDHM